MIWGARQWPSAPGMIGVLKREGWGLTMAGTSTRFRRRIRGFERFEMRSRALCWDDKFIYLEQSMWKRNGECASHVLYRSAVNQQKRYCRAAHRAVGNGATDHIARDAGIGWQDGGAAETHRPWPAHAGRLEHQTVSCAYVAALFYLQPTKNGVAMTQITARKRIWGWYFFDWASQPYNTLLLTFIFGPYFAQTATASLVEGGMELSAAKAQAQAYWGYGLAIAGIAIAILAPILGAVADSSGKRLPWVWLFSLLYVVGSGALWWTAPQDFSVLWALFFFGIGLIGMEFATIFTNAYLPELSPGPCRTRAYFRGRLGLWLCRWGACH